MSTLNPASLSLLLPCRRETLVEPGHVTTCSITASRLGYRSSFVNRCCPGDRRDMHAEKMAKVRPHLFTSFFKCLQTTLCSSGYHNIILKVKQAICLECFLPKERFIGVLADRLWEMSGISSSSSFVEGERL